MAERKTYIQGKGDLKRYTVTNDRKSVITDPNQSVTEGLNVTDENANNPQNTAVGNGVTNENTYNGSMGVYDDDLIEQEERKGIREG